MRWGALLLLSLLPGVSAATDALPYLRIPAGARSAAMGGAYCMVPSDLETLWTNPAGLAGYDGGALFSYMTWLSEVDSQFFSFSFPLKPGRNLGLALSRDGTSDTYRNVEGMEGGSFGISDTVIQAGFGLGLDRLDVGAALKWVHESLDVRRGDGFLADAGAILGLLAGSCRVGASLQNAGTAPDYGGGRPPAPLLLRLGALERGLVRGLEFTQEYRQRLLEGTGSFSAGVQFTQVLGETEASLRGGFNSQYANVEEASGWAAGAGLGFNDIRLDYMYAPFGFMGNTQRFTLRYEFPTDKKPTPTPTPSPTATPTATVPAVGQIQVVPLQRPVPTPTPTAPPSMEVGVEYVPK